MDADRVEPYTGKRSFLERLERRQERGEGEEIQVRLYFAVRRSDDPGVYINMSMWESRDAFQDWRGSDSFKRAHSSGLPEWAIAGRPQLIVGEVVYN